MERPEDGMMTFQLPVSLLWRLFEEIFLAKVDHENGSYTIIIERA
jgi:hypothetical protein